MKTVTDQFSRKARTKKTAEKAQFLYFVGRAFQKLRVLYEHFNHEGPRLKDTSFLSSLSFVRK
jgi:hypothetical protein